MSQEKERSTIFKFFYVILCIVTFPIYIVLFMLRHPVWMLFLLMLVLGAAIYWPISQGVAVSEVMGWYQTKYGDIERKVVNIAAEKGVKDFLPQAVVKDVKRMDAEAKEELEPKSENYNRKVVRDKKIEEAKIAVKKRGGFKKKEVVEEHESEDKKAEDIVEVLTATGSQSGGLSEMLKEQQKNSDESSAETVNDVNKDAMENEENKLPAVEENLPQEAPVIEKETPAKNGQNSEDNLDLDLF